MSRGRGRGLSPCAARVAGGHSTPARSALRISAPRVVPGFWSVGRSRITGAPVPAAAAAVGIISVAARGAMAGVGLRADLAAR